MQVLPVYKYPFCIVDSSCKNPNRDGINSNGVKGTKDEIGTGSGKGSLEI